jgi:hypothetical protein
VKVKPRELEGPLPCCAHDSGAKAHTAPASARWRPEHAHAKTLAKAVCVIASLTCKLSGDGHTRRVDGRGCTVRAQRSAHCTRRAHGWPSHATAGLGQSGYHSSPLSSCRNSAPRREVRHHGAPLLRPQEPFKRTRFVLIAAVSVSCDVADSRVPRVDLAALDCCGYVLDARVTPTQFQLHIL